MTYISGKDNVDDTLFSFPFSNDTIDGRSGFDVVYGFGAAVDARLATTVLINGKPVLAGPGYASSGSQHDKLISIEGIIGSSFNDTLTGSNSDNSLIGGLGNDTLNGLSGNDSLVGGEGNDTLTGGGGADRFVFNSLTEAADSITDFTVLDDTISVKASGFSGGLIPGAISTDQFHLGNTAADSSDRFIYNRTGTLFFDADGTGSAFGQVAVATLTGAPTLSAANIVVI